MEADAVVVGGGVLGVTTAFWLSQRYDCTILLLERERDVATQNTLRNTGIAHRPFYMDPAKKRLLARAAERSHTLWAGLAKRHGVSWNEAGTLMVATEERQLKTLETYLKWGVENGLDEREYQLLDGRQVGELEPSVKCLGGVLSRRDASTDFAALTRKVWEMAERNGARLLAGADVASAEDKDGKVSVSLKDGRRLDCALMVNTAGGRSLDIAHGMGLAEEYTDLHFRGEYWEVDSARAPPVKRSVYSVARREKFAFLDPHYIVRADGRKEVGPNAVLVAGPETYKGVGGAKILSKLAERPLGPKARLFTNGEFLSLVWDEWRSSLSKKAMCARVRRFVPSLQPEMLPERGLAGVRSALVGREGFVPEAMVVKGERSIHVLNYNSPGATGAPAFAAELVNEIERDGLLGSASKKGRSAGLWSFEEALPE